MRGRRPCSSCLRRPSEAAQSTHNLANEIFKRWYDLDIPVAKSRTGPNERPRNTSERLHASATRPAANWFLAFEGAIQKLGDHASISTTMTFSHLSPTTLASSMACRVADVISRISKLRDGT